MKELLAKIKDNLTGEKLKHNLKKTWQFIANPRLLLCFLIGWLITNGWSYILFGLGTYFEINWMIAVSGAYLAFLWLPISPEKIVTCAIAIALLRWLFPQDQKTLAVLRGWYEKAKTAIHARRERKAEEKAAKASQEED
ncbi:MAG: hypothetical protein E7318_02695 [Clostridiales bacterium]|nr:hypothetical protein [Clostridiales bacterium]